MAKTNKFKVHFAQLEYDLSTDKFGSSFAQRINWF